MIIGDDISLAVFAYYGSAEKIANLYYPGSNWCVNGVYFKGNSLNVQCNGAGVSTYVNFGFLDGQYLLGLYGEMSDFDVILNGKISTLEEMNRIYPLDQAQEKTRREQMQFLRKDECWTLCFESGDSLAVNDSLDFERFLWN